MLFSASLHGREDWAKVFQSPAHFSALAEHILQTHGLPAAKLQKLTPGTNAVFRSGDCVVKIFAPKESGFDGEKEFHSERAALARANEKALPVSKILAAGKLQDRYLFPYLVLEYIDGKDAKEVLPHYTPAQKEKFCASLRRAVCLFNTPDSAAPDLPVLQKRNRPLLLAKTLNDELDALFETAVQHPFVPVHGDLTEDNVLIKPDGSYCIIDWADSLLAPAFYEYPPLVFGLLGAGADWIFCYFSEREPAQILDQLLLGLSLHRFRQEILHDWFRSLSVSPKEILSVETLKTLMIKSLLGKDSHSL